jgi:hypothetical protein
MSYWCEAPLFFNFLFYQMKSNFYRNFQTISQKLPFLVNTSFGQVVQMNESKGKYFCRCVESVTKFDRNGWPSMSHDTIFGSWNDMNDTIFGLPRALECPIFSCKAIKKYHICGVLDVCWQQERETSTNRVHESPTTFSTQSAKDYYRLNSKLGPLAVWLNWNSKIMQSPCTTLLLWPQNWCAVVKHEKRMLIMNWKWRPTSSTQAKAFYH